MYHIQNDVRAKRSAELIGEGMQKCLERKRFEEITIVDLQKASSVGRSTFYRLFDHTADVLLYLCDSVFEQAEQEYQRRGTMTTEESMQCFIRIWMEHKTLLKAIVDSGRTEILRTAHRKYLTKQNTFFPGIESLEPLQAEYFLNTLAACTTAFLSVWIENGGTESAEQLQNHLKVCFRMLGESVTSTDARSAPQSEEHRPAQSFPAR